MSATFEDGKDDGALRTIGEVSAALGIKTHVLRYWEQQFPLLQPLKRSGGRRYYRPEDVALVKTIDRLINHEGYTLKGAAKALKDGALQVAVASVADAPPKSPVPTLPPAVRSPAPPELIAQLRTIRNTLALALEH